jgi:hypothetical protein
MEVSAAMATVDGLEGRNRKLGRILLGIVLFLMVVSIIRVLTHN